MKEEIFNIINHEENITSSKPNIILTGSKDVDYSNEVISCTGVEFDYGAEEEEALMGAYF